MPDSSYGAVGYGAGAYGETTRTVNVPPSTATTATPQPSLGVSGTAIISSSATAAYGSTSYGDAAYGRGGDLVSTVRTSAPEPGVTGVGVIDVAAPASPLTTTTPSPVPTLVLSAPVSTATTTTPTPDVGFGEWVLGGNGIGANTDETETYRTLTLTQRVTTTTLKNNVRPAKTDEGQVDVLPQDDGGYVAVDRANGDNTFTLTAPITRQPLRRSTDVHVTRYEESLVSQAVDEWDVELELQYDSERTDSPSISETVGAGEWGFTLVTGTIATDRVDAEFIGTGSDGVPRFEVTARLTFDQAHSFEAALNRVGAHRVRTIPDSNNVVVDDTSGSRNTVTVDSPTTGVVSDGNYVVTEWSSLRINDGFQEVNFVLAETG